MKPLSFCPHYDESITYQTGNASEWPVIRYWKEPNITAIEEGNKMRFIKNGTWELKPWNVWQDLVPYYGEPEIITGLEAIAHLDKLVPF